MRCDRLWRNARIATCAAGMPGLGIVGPERGGRGAIAAQGGRILWAGPEEETPAFAAGETIDCGGRWITPGLVDCHTHMIFGGDRSGEFARRLAGESYESIAREGGGIRATMRATRTLDEAGMREGARGRLAAWAAEGVTTVEIKSGYGLDEATERAMLRAARDIGAEGGFRVAASYLGAHAMPPEMARADYLDLVCGRMIPAIARDGLADAVDAFCEDIAFTADEVALVFAAAKAAGMAVKLHADQRTDTGGAALAARFGALSADHLEYAAPEGLAAMARAGSVAVLLPGAYYVLRETKRPDVAAMRASGCAMAVATDCNPGTSPLASLRLAAHMGCVFFGLTIEEVWLGITRHAAAALGLAAETGTIEAGKSCDLAIWNAETPAQVLGWIGPAPLERRVIRGLDA